MAGSKSNCWNGGMPKLGTPAVTLLPILPKKWHIMGHKVTKITKNYQIKKQVSLVTKYL
jgi:hypothetical protein